MAIKRYAAIADTTITNAFKQNLVTRGTGSNMGASDILETFSIYSQVSGAGDGHSQELSRMLLKFNISGSNSIHADRLSGKIPASGSVSFYLRMFNAVHPTTLPERYTLNVLPVSSSWDEGMGLDMEDYVDKDEANWTDRARVTEVTKLTIGTDVKATLGAGSGANYATAYNGMTPYNFWFNDGSGDSAPSADGVEIEVDISAGDLDTAAEFATTLANTADALAAFSANAVSNIVYITASFGNPTTKPSTTGYNSSVVAAATTQTDVPLSWTAIGGDYHSAVAYVGGKNLPSATGYFEVGDEDLEVNITALVEEWIQGETGSLTGGDYHHARINYGLGVHLTSSHEAYFNSSTGQNTTKLIHNPVGSKYSYYTKRFFGRGSEFFLKKPVIEARWAPANKDDAGNFYLSSSLMPGEENLNTLYLYNYVKGRLQNIPNSSVHSNAKVIHLSLYSGSTGNIYDKLALPVGGDVAANTHTNVTGGIVSAGIYTASLACTHSISSVYPVWHYEDLAAYHSGSAIVAKPHNASNYNQKPSFVTNITNLKGVYSRDETARFRVFVRQKDWNPTVYTVASTAISASIIESSSYKVIRVADDYEVISYTTGSDYVSGSNTYAQLSYDVSGNYFDLDMSVFEKDYAYRLEFAHYTNNTWTEQEETFKFRVE